MQAILGQVTAMLETAAAQLGPATEVEVEALARRAQVLIADKVEELASTLPQHSDNSSGSSTPRVSGVDTPSCIRAAPARGMVQGCCSAGFRAACFPGKPAWPGRLCQVPAGHHM